MYASSLLTASACIRKFSPISIEFTAKHRTNEQFQPDAAMHACAAAQILDPAFFLSEFAKSALFTAKRHYTCAYHSYIKLLSL